VIEVEITPSIPEDRVAPNTFGEIPSWLDLVKRRRATLALGRQDLQIESLVPFLSGVMILRVSPDHVVLDVTETSPTVILGGEPGFRPFYEVVATGKTSAVATQIVMV
jgi:predicted amino acid racemase